MKLPKGFTEKPAYKVKANKSKKAHDSIVKTVSNAPEGPPLPPLTADELRALIRQVDANKSADNSSPATAVIVPRSKNYSTFEQWRAGPISDGNEEYEAWKDWRQAANWDLNLLLLDQIEKIKVFMINRVADSEKELVQNFEAPFPRWWIYWAQLKRNLKAKNAYAPLKNGCDALSHLIQAYDAAIEGDFRKANIKTIHGMAHGAICVVQQFEHEIILGRSKFDSNKKSAQAPRPTAITEIIAELAKKTGRAKELWPQLYSALEDEGFEVIDCSPTEWAYKYRKRDLEVEGEYQKIIFRTFSNNLTTARR